MDAETAKRIAEAYIAQTMAEDGIKYVVYDQPEESADGWFFSYQSKKFVETNDMDYSLVGNWPVLVNREGECLGARRPPSYLDMEVDVEKSAT